MGVAWIAGNDEPEDLNAESVAEYISTTLLADIFGLPAEGVGRDVVEYRLSSAEVIDLDAIRQSRAEAQWEDDGIS